MIFSSPLATTLEEIVTGKHNNPRCKRYEKRHIKKWNRSPKPCRFRKTQTVSKLIEKVSIEDVSDVVQNLNDPKNIGKLPSGQDQPRNIFFTAPSVTSILGIRSISGNDVNHKGVNC